MSEQSRNEPCACGSGKKYKKCCYLTKVFEPLKAPEPPKGARLTNAQRQQLVDEGIAAQGGRICVPNAVYPCWRCGTETRLEPCDADGSGETGMLWPPFCRSCGDRDDALPVRVDAFQARFPGTKHAIAAESVLSLVNQAYYRMLARRGWKPGQTPSRT